MSTIEVFVLSLAVVGAGVSLALQQVLNADLRVALGSPWWAAFASYGVGAVATLALALVLPGPKMTSAMLVRPPWFVWGGGLLGAIFVVTAILALPRLGAATTLGLVVVGQMAGALAFDQAGLLGLERHPVGAPRVVGAMLLVLGVVLVRR